MMKANYLLLLLMTFMMFSACQSGETTSAPISKKGLIKIAILYPNGEGHRFDMDYYSTKHMPMVVSLFGDMMIDMEIEKGIAGRTPEDPIPYLAAGYFFFESLESYQKAFGANAEQILGDVPNYTNIQPVVQISEVIR
ncbi:MAG: EthD family reductase [Bacteroidota bacterium]